MNIDYYGPLLVAFIGSHLNIIPSYPPSENNTSYLLMSHFQLKVLKEDQISSTTVQGFCKVAYV